jgi:hypothetical protein
MLSPHRTARRSRLPTSLQAHRQTSLLDEMAHHMTTTRTTAAISAAILIAVPLAGLSIASSAQAHDGGITATCTSLSANLSKYPGGSTIGGIVDGINLGTSTFGPSFSQTLPLDPTIPHTWTITVKSGDGDSRYDFEKTGASDPACIPVVVPPVEEPPIVTPPPVVVTEPRAQNYADCLGGRFVLDNTGSTTDATYVVQGTSYVVPAGTALHTDADADGTLYQPYDGTYTITAGDQTWTFPTAGNCPTEEVLPTDEPTEQPSPPAEHTPSPSQPGATGATPNPSTPSTPQSSQPNTPTTVQNVAATVPDAVPTVSPVAQPADALAYTGTRDLTAWIALAAALIAAGIASKVVPILRRRKDTHA